MPGVLKDCVSSTAESVTQRCGLPMCDLLVNPSPRYPSYVCSDCRHQSPPVDASGNQIDFFNADFAGGFISETTVNGEKIRGNNHECFIRGVRCRADEARFGGIVITTAQD